MLVVVLAYCGVWLVRAKTMTMTDSVQNGCVANVVLLMVSYVSSPRFLYVCVFDEFWQEMWRATSIDVMSIMNM
jgi:hypothetical protein